MWEKNKTPESSPFFFWGCLGSMETVVLEMVYNGKKIRTHIYIYIFLYKLYILFIIVGYMHIHTDLEYFDHSLNYERIVQAFVYDIALANGISL